MIQIKREEKQRRMKYIADVKKWKERLKNKPQSFIALKNLLQLSCWLERPKAIINYTTKILQMNPLSSEAYRWRGHAYLMMHKNKRAVNLYKKAILMHPYNKEAYLSLASGYHFLKNRRQQLVTLKKALSKFPNCWEILHAIGWFYERKELYEKAIPWYQQALKANTKSTWTLIHLAHVLYMAEHYEQSSDVYRQLIKLNPKDQDARKGLTDALRLLAECKIKESYAIKNALQENRILIDKNKNMAVDLMKMSNNFFTIALHRALMGKWNEWNKSMPIGTTFKFNDEMLLKTGDARVVHLTRLSNSLHDTAETVKDVLTGAYLTMPVKQATNTEN